MDKISQSIVAAYIKTESGDDCLHVYTDVVDTIDLIQRLKNEYDEEFAYIGNIIINADLCHGKIDKNLIWAAIEEAQ